MEPLTVRDLARLAARDEAWESLFDKALIIGFAKGYFGEEVLELTVDEVFSEEGGEMEDKLEKREAMRVLEAQGHDLEWLSDFEEWRCKKCGALLRDLVMLPQPQPCQVNNA